MKIAVIVLALMVSQNGVSGGPGGDEASSKAGATIKKHAVRPSSRRNTPGLRVMLGKRLVEKASKSKRPKSDLQQLLDKGLELAQKRKGIKRYY